MEMSRIILILGYLVSCVYSECPDGWVKFHHSCYLFSHTKLNFFDAETLCHQEGGYLTHIETKEENTFIKSFCDDLKVERRWFGLTDHVIENRWVWHNTNDTPSFFDWGPQQPNQGKSANCGVLWEQQAYTWGDDPCANLCQSICEKPLNPDVEPVG